jgi:L-2-hydroxyglutarate oxidase LhgO
MPNRLWAFFTSIQRRVYDLVEEMTKKGINFRFNSIINCFEKVPEGFNMHTEDGSSITTDLVMYATGPCT